MVKYNGSAVGFQLRHDLVQQDSQRNAQVVAGGDGQVDGVQHGQAPQVLGDLL